PLELTSTRREERIVQLRECTGKPVPSSRRVPSGQVCCRGAEPPSRGSRVVGCQLRGACEERGRSRGATAEPRAICSALELGGNLCIGKLRRRGAMPCTPVLVAFDIAGVGQRMVSAATVVGASALVHGGPDKWMTKLELRTGLEQPRCLRRRDCALVEA